MAVHTPLSEPEMRDIARIYGLGDLKSMTGLTEGVENTTYRIDTDSGVFIFSLFEGRGSDAESADFITRVAHLAAEQGCPVPSPLKTQKGHLWITLRGKPAFVTPLVPGQTQKAPAPGACKEAARVLAQLHLSLQDSSCFRANPTGPAYWQKLSVHCQGQGMESIDHRCEIEAILGKWPKNLAAGIIHGDYFPNNVFFNACDEVTGVIDWGFACTEMLAYDLAMMLNAWGFGKDGTKDPARFEATLGGYQSARELGADERAALPLLARGAALRFYLTRLYDALNHPPAATHAPLDPQEYALKLQYWREQSL